MVISLRAYDGLANGSDQVGRNYMFHNCKAVAALAKERNDTVFQAGMAAHHVFRKNFYMDMAIPLAGCAHQAGTCRFGTDPATSVLDTDCKAHELDNLYVVDTSFFPSIGAVNPALLAGLLAKHTAKAPPGQPANVPAQRETTGEQDLASRSGHGAEPKMGQAG